MAEPNQLDDIDPEVLRLQMEESREALAQKFEMLEEKVSESVQTATATVAEATANVLETVQTATSSVSETVGSVTQAVQGTVDNVRQTVEGTVDSVKDAFDVSRQVEQHPWAMLGAAAALGFVGGTLIGNSHGKAREPRRRKAETHRVNGNGEPFAGAPFQPTYTTSLPTSPFTPTATAEQIKAPVKPGWLEQLRQTFAPEIAKLEGLAIGVAMGALRDVIVKAVPPDIKKEVEGVIDDFTEKLGGQCLSSHASRSNPGE